MNLRLLMIVMALGVPVGFPAIALGQKVQALPIKSEADAIKKNLIKNSDFQNGLDHWINLDPARLQISVENRNGRKALKMSCEPPAEAGWPMVVQDLNLTPGKAYTVSVGINSKNIRDGAGPYSVIEYLDAAGNRLGLSDAGTTVVPAAAAAARINLILHGHGTAWFSNVTVKEFTLPDSVTLPKEVSGRIASKPNRHPLLGIGFEDDGYSYTQGNLQNGENEASLALREERIRWLKPGHVRMFVWMGEWLPAGFFNTNTPAAYLWDSDFMQSKIRSLQQYQALGTPVNITGVEWGGSGYLGPMWQDPARAARAYADLLEYLVKTQGLTCIRYFALSNEPNLNFVSQGGSLENFGAIHRLLKQELITRKLDVTLIGSDDANDAAWFSNCVASKPYRDSVGCYSSHTYLKQYELNPASSAGFFKFRMGALARSAPEKPFIVGEFGFHGEEATSMSNPLMKTYDYALYATDFMLQGLSQGVSGFSIWVLHQVHFPAAGASAAPLMAYGMWDYKATPGVVHPVYHAMANFTRNTATGNAITPVAINGALVRACIVGENLFWVNLRKTPVTFSAKEFSPAENTTYSEKTLNGEKECGTLVPITGGTCELAPRSFGRMKLATAKQ